MYKLYNENSGSPVTRAYLRLINENNQEFDIIKIFDYMTLGADTTQKNEQGHTLMEMTIIEFNRCTKYLNDSSDTKTLMDKVVFIDDMTSNLLLFINGGYKMNEVEQKMISQFFELMIKIDLKGSKFNTDTVHKKIINIISNLDKINDNAKTIQSLFNT